MRVVQVDKKQLNTVKESIRQGFSWATREGPLCEERKYRPHLSWTSSSISLPDGRVDVASPLPYHQPFLFFFWACRRFPY